MASGELEITITAVEANGTVTYSYTVTSDTTGGAATFTAEAQGGFQLTTQAPGIFSFVFTASNFQFSNPAMTWNDPGANRNLTWMSNGSNQFAIADINYTPNQQPVSFTINPSTNSSDVSGAVTLPPIDPTVLNVPDPGGALAVAA
ncbi:MAG TPA: hypothetical protein VFC23_01020 [Thermoanaerobaculia bacterium]|nr:hypothetical protein [Thermoanaerobaculia bacterium]